MASIRKAVKEDITFIEEHAYRLLEFGPPAWRKEDLTLMTKADIHHISAAVLSPDPDIEVFVALNDQQDPCGFLHLTMQTDYYTKELHAHITDIVVTKQSEGMGIGKLLMQKADEWAKEKKARWITLNVFEENSHAQERYEKAGFQKEWIKYLKVLD